MSSVSVPLDVAVRTPDGVTHLHALIPVTVPERVTTDLSNATTEELLAELRRRLKTLEELEGPDDDS